MPDTLTAQPPATVATASKITRGVINKSYLDELQAARKVAAAALDPDQAAGLAAVECDPTLAPDIVTLADEIETALGLLTGTRAAKKTATVEEASAREALLAVLQPIQTAAKRAFADDQSTLREAYGIGRGLSGETLASVVTLARGVLIGTKPPCKKGPPSLCSPTRRTTPYRSFIMVPTNGVRFFRGWPASPYERLPFQSFHGSLRHPHGVGRALRAILQPDFGHLGECDPPARKCRD